MILLSLCAAGMLVERDESAFFDATAALVSVFWPAPVLGVIERKEGKQAVS
jgi:hypothetical protein